MDAIKPKTKLDVLLAEYKAKERELQVAGDLLARVINIGDKRVKIYARPVMQDLEITIESPQYGIGGTSTCSVYIPLVAIGEVASFLNELLAERGPMN